MSAPASREWILAIRLRQLGDVLATLGALQALRAHNARRAIAFVVDAPYADLVRGLPYVDRVLVPPRGGAGAWLRFLREVRAVGATATLDFHGSARSALLTRVSGAGVRAGFDVRLRKHAYTVVEPRADFAQGVVVPRTSLVSAMRLAHHVGVAPIDGAMPRIESSPALRDATRARWADSGVPGAQLAAGRVVGLNPGRPVASKRWPLEGFADLARRLVRDGHTVVVFWGPGEEDAARALVESTGHGVVLAPAFTLAELPAALSHVRLLVTIDSGLKHLAVCARTPTVTLFGPTDPREWHMGTAHDVVLWKGLSCSPCRLLACPFGAPPCMDVSADHVYAQASALLRGAA